MKDLISKIKENRLPYAFFIKMLKEMTIVDKSYLKSTTCYEYNGNIIIEHPNNKKSYIL